MDGMWRFVEHTTIGYWCRILPGQLQLQQCHVGCVVPASVAFVRQNRNKKKWERVKQMISRAMKSHKQTKMKLEAREAISLSSILFIVRSRDTVHTYYLLEGSLHQSSEITHLQLISTLTVPC